MKYTHKIYLWTLLLLSSSFHLLANTRVDNIICDDNNTPDIRIDDIFTFDLTVTGNGNSWTAMHQGNAVFSGSYGQHYNLGTYPIIDGEIVYIIIDDDSGVVIDTLSVEPPFSCSACTTIEQVALCEQDRVELSVNIDTSHYLAYRWYHNDIPLSNENQLKINVVAAGSYDFRASIDPSSSCFDDIGSPIEIRHYAKPQAIPELINSCPTLQLTGEVASNDLNLNDSEYVYSVKQTPQFGNLRLSLDGTFSIEFDQYECLSDSFVYEVCHPVTNCCATATCRIELSDTEPPLLLGIPDDITLDCSEELPSADNVIAVDECTETSIEMNELVSEGDCETFITRIWTTTDHCGNTTSARQTIILQDIMPPVIYKVHTLPNGKKMVAGIIENVSHHWNTVSLPVEFATTPLIFTQNITSRAYQPTSIQIKEISTQQFKIRLQQAAEERDWIYPERVAWIAIEAGNVQENYTLSAEVVTAANHDWQNITFPHTFEPIPVLIAQPQTTSEANLVNVRIDNLSTTGVSVYLSEEASEDSELNQMDEAIAYMAATATNSSNQLTDSTGMIIGEIGRASTNHHWLPISYRQSYHNPIVVVGGMSYRSENTSILQIRRVTTQGFEVRVAEWSELDEILPMEDFSYWVIEGSVPQDLPNNCQHTLTEAVRTSMIAYDNCSGVVPIEYTESTLEVNHQSTTRRFYTAIDPCGIETQLETVNTCSTVNLQLRAYLQGALMEDPTATLMLDNLRILDYLPDDDPYVEYPDFTHFGLGGNNKIAKELLKVEGSDAVVDWVFIELKSVEFPDSVVATRAALLQRDGDVIDSQGGNTLDFPELPPADYFVSIRHRNHLGVTTALPISFTEKNTPMVDFGLPTTEVIGGRNVRKISTDRAMLWAGDINGDQQIIYQGPSNDRSYIDYTVLNSESNTGYFSNYIHAGYDRADINMDGNTIAEGLDNDLSRLIFEVILSHPENSNLLLSFIIEGNL